MKRSTDRVLTTHVGSLVRPAEIIEVLRAEQYGDPYDQAAFAQTLRPAVSDVVRRQVEAGVDVPSDGEFGKVSWTAYVVERLGGLTQQPMPEGGRPLIPRGQDRRLFADFYAVYDPISVTMWMPPSLPRRGSGGAEDVPPRWECTGPITYRGQAAIERDITNFKAALAAASVEEGFLPLAAPASIEASCPNRYYPTDEAYLYALADALKQEYRAVVDAGLVLQVDDAFIPFNYDRLLPDVSMEDYRKHSDLRIEAVNYALQGIPPERVRYHICWGSWAGPHTTDVPLKDIVDLLLKVNAQAYSVEAANPRHEYEWQVWQTVKLAEGKTLIPGVITHSTNVVEHPETVAERIQRYASVVGRENVIAGTDCGFAQGWYMARTHPSVQWAKLRALADGARLASQRLWAA
jgi:5-methyltetrahydropteroyltriglutamate--homocysteine methyltransferase